METNFFAALLMAGSALFTPFSFQEGAPALVPIGVYATEIFDESAAEIPDYDPTTQRVFVVNGSSLGIDILDLSVPSHPTLIGMIDLSMFGKGANSVSVKNGVVAVAVENWDRQSDGQAAFFDTDGQPLASVTVGPQPDMIKWTPDGRTVLVALEGEPDDGYDRDPDGGIALIDVSDGPEAVTQDSVIRLDFSAWNDNVPAGARIAKPGASFAADAEPEYIAVSPDSRRAWAVLQENNALALIDVPGRNIVDLVGLGTKDFSKIPFDASNKDGAINIRTWPVRSFYMPDAIEAYEATDGRIYIVSANEGHSRDYEGFSEEKRVGKLTLDSAAFPNAAELQKSRNLGRLKVTTSQGDADGDGRFEALYAFGGRSFSIWDANGALVWDSGAQFEEITAQVLPTDFNAADDENRSFDARSDDKGPEPEAVTVGRIGERIIAFIGLSHVSGIMVYDITDPRAPQFIDYVNNRNFSGNPHRGTARDLGPEGLVFIPADQSPNGQPLLVAANEVSGTTTVYRVRLD